jgi:hypothetical protein
LNDSAMHKYANGKEEGSMRRASLSKRTAAKKGGPKSEPNALPPKINKIES